MGKLRLVIEPVKSRPYRSVVRAERARETRSAVLDAARRVFSEQGYAAATVAAIATEAGVAVDTIYATVGPKPVLFRLLLETAISGADEAIPAEERDYVRRMKAEPRAWEKLQIYAAAIVAISERMGPLHLVLRDAAAQVPELAQIRDDIATRRAANMRLLAKDLIDTGDLRPGLTIDEIADVIWTMNSAEFHHLLVRERGWSPAAFERWLADCWCRLFLAAPDTSHQS